MIGPSDCSVHIAHRGGILGVGIISYYVMTSYHVCAGRIESRSVFAQAKAAWRWSAWGTDHARHVVVVPEKGHLVS